MYVCVEFSYRALKGELDQLQKFWDLNWRRRMKGFSLHCFHKCSLRIAPGVPRFKDPVLCSQEKSLQSPGGREAVSYHVKREGELAIYFQDRPHPSGLWAIHTHPQHHSLPAPKVSHAASFCTFWRFVSLIYVYNCTTLVFWTQYFTAILSYFLQLCGFVSLKIPVLYFQWDFRSKIRYTSSTHSLT